MNLYFYKKTDAIIANDIIAKNIGYPQLNINGKTGKRDANVQQNTNWCNITYDEQAEKWYITKPDNKYMIGINL